MDFIRVVASLVAGELADARKTSVLVEPLVSISAATKLTGGGLEVDSLELMRLAAAVNEMFHLHETTAGDYLLQHRNVGAWAGIVEAAWALGQERLTFRTSGSSGEPKRCRQDVAQLEREVAEHAAHFPGVNRVLAAVPAHHIYGFIFTVLLPARLGCEVIDVRTWPPARFIREVRASDLIVAVPAFWEYLSRSVERFATPVCGVTSTAPCPESRFARLEEQGVRLTEIYGSSETAGIGRRVAAGAAFELLSFWERSRDVLVRKSETADGRGKEEAFELPDDLEWMAERAFFVRGRRDGAVQVGGTNVFPERIAAKIARHPEVRECAVRLMRADEGDRLKAFVVAREAGDEEKAADALREWMRSELAACERPAALKFGAVLPRNELGKLTDWDA